MRRRTWLLGIAGAAAAMLVGAGVLMAQSDEPTASGTSFLDRVAGKLGIGSDKLEQAVHDARVDQINERAASGDLTQAEADELIQRLDEMPPDAPFFGPGPGGEFGFKGGDHPFGFHFGFGMGGGIGAGVDGEALATFLGISTDQLHQELTADNATLASVAEAHGKSRDELKSFILDTANQRLATAVTNGDLTQTQADNIKSKLDAMVDGLIDNTLPAKGRFHFRMDDNDGDDAPAPQGSAVPATPSS